MFDKEKFENVTELIYLSVKMNSWGSFASALSHLRVKCDRAIFSVNNKYKIHRLKCVQRKLDIARNCIIS